MKKKVINISIIIFFIIGLSLLLYPTVANQWNTYRQSKLMSNYEEQIEEMQSSGEVDMEAEWEKAEAYNEALLPTILPDSFAIAEAKQEEDKTYTSSLNLMGDGMMGKVVIPKIDVNLPVFHYTTKEVLENGVGHLEGSSLPIGGESSHSVLSAHRGLPSASLFTDLDQLELGDHFLIYVLDDVLCYEVDQVKVVEPKETEDLSVEDGKDLMTLFTCTPYGVNTHRLLVRGHRVPYEETILTDEHVPTSNRSLHTNYLLWVFVGLAVTGLLILVMYRIDKKRREKHSSEREDEV